MKTRIIAALIEDKNIVDYMHMLIAGLQVNIQVDWCLSKDSNGKHPLLFTIIDCDISACNYGNPAHKILIDKKFADMFVTYDISEDVPAIRELLVDNARSRYLAGN